MHSLLQVIRFKRKIMPLLAFMQTTLMENISFTLELQPLKADVLSFQQTQDARLGEVFAELVHFLMHFRLYFKKRV